MTIVVTINGGPVNVFEHYGLPHNPFPATPFPGANRILALLDSDPLHSEDEIRTILAGCSQEFVNLCCARFVPGKRISFNIEFPL